MAIMGPFPLGEWFIPEVRKAAFLRAEPLLFNIPNRTACSDDGA